MIEAGTFLALGALSEKGITVTNCEIAELSSAFEVLTSLGTELGFGKDGITARRGEKNNFTELTATPYPGFPTDLQPIFAVPMHISGGKITDTVWPSRFGYLSELARFGLVYRTVGNTAYIEPSRLDSAVASAPDLRGGMACIMAAILAKGKSVVDSVEIVERGYENLEAKLRSLGADVKIFEE
jgi:UDP-N-acetylglucosamine 1-carboxyvinyltransferase